MSKSKFGLAMSLMFLRQVHYLVLVEQIKRKKKKAQVLHPKAEGK